MEVFHWEFSWIRLRCSSETHQSATAWSSATELGQQPYRSSRGVHSVSGFESPTISMVFRKWIGLRDSEPFFFWFFQNDIELNSLGHWTALLLIIYD